MSKIRLAAENIGGIESETVDFDTGTTLVVGTNASNKTSLLRSVEFALGIDELPMRSGTDEAGVQLSFDGITVERTAKRNGAGYRIEGDGWVGDPEDALLVRRFACLLGTNPLRSAVARNEDVESLLKEPMDIEALEDERARKLQRKRELRRDLERLEDVDEQLDEREAILETKRERTDELESELDELYDEQESTESTDDRLQELRDERTDLRAERDNYANQIEELEATIDRLEERKADMGAELEAAREAAADFDVDQLKQRRESIQEELSQVTERIDVLQSVLTANREMLSSEFAGSLGYDPGLMGDEISCWACGNAAPREDFEGTLEELREVVEQDKQRKRDREPELSELEGKIDDAVEARRRVEKLESERSDIDQRLQQRRDSLEQKRSEHERVEDELESVGEQITERESEQEESRSDVASEIEETRLELQMLRREVDRIEEVVSDLEAKREERNHKRETVEQLTTEIQELTNRIENLEGDLREVFNETMDELISVLGFERIERVRLDGDFQIVIARDTDGVIREDSIEHLAESEREIIGLVLGLAGFLVYEVDEISPVLLLDSLGAFDATRTQRLIEYFDGTTDALLAAVHPEKAEDLEYESISMV